MLHTLAVEDKGFTLIELALVVVILAVMAVSVSVAFRTSEGDLDAVSIALRSNIELAQDLAITNGSAFGFRSINATSYEIFNGAPGTPAIDPLTQGNFVVNISPVQFSGVVQAISFDARGVPSNPTDATITLIDGGHTRTLTVSSETGVVTLVNL
jgi:prepilin-type N-terminal cleavage/methylation domain-containing protein